MPDGALHGDGRDATLLRDAGGERASRALASMAQPLWKGREYRQLKVTSGRETVSAGEDLADGLATTRRGVEERLLPVPGGCCPRLRGDTGVDALPGHEIGHADDQECGTVTARATPESPTGAIAAPCGGAVPGEACIVL